MKLELNNSRDKIAIIYDNIQYSYYDLKTRISFFSDFIKINNINKGDIVLILGNYSIDSISLFFALHKNNNIIIPVISNNEEELKKKIRISKASKVINIDKLLVEKIQSENIDNDMLLSLINNGKSGLILFSSGSTGEPKAMLHDLDNLIITYNTSKKRNLVFLVFLMFDHIGGLNTMLNILSMQSTMVLPVERSPDHIGGLIEKYKVNILPTSPSFLNLMNISNVYEKYDFSSVIMVTYGTEPMPQNLLLDLKSKLKRTKFLQTFGTSETGIIKTSSKSSDSLLIKFDDPNQKTKIVDGELWIKSNVRVSGYLNHSNKSFTEDGWFKTGDLVEVHENGYYKIKGRKSEVINIGGEKVIPLEVENVIMKLSFIKDVTIYSQENSILGQIMLARVVKDQSIPDLDAKKIIRKHCKEHLDKFKVPSKIIFEKNLNLSDRFKKKRNNLK